VAELDLGQDFPIEVIDGIFNEADSNDDGMISFDGMNMLFKCVYVTYCRVRTRDAVNSCTP
jgi:hypothetical protein